MKTKEEIEKMAIEPNNYGIFSDNKELPLSYHIFNEGYIKGYLACQQKPPQSDAVEYKQKCRKEALAIVELAKPIADANQDTTTKTMFDLLDMVLTLTNDNHQHLQQSAPTD